MRRTKPINLLKRVTTDASLDVGAIALDAGVATLNAGAIALNARAASLDAGAIALDTRAASLDARHIPIRDSTKKEEGTSFCSFFFCI
ncbi:hypothetical protein ABE073_15355 [Lederbergia citrisecunda]|uniref:hypothetical protein n=1 Tax=Lederbergia citrisecunda TaxID=2833583 RepID=UPI003D26D28F